MNFVYVLILILTADGQIVNGAGAAVESMDACHESIEATLPKLGPIIPEGGRTATFCFNMKPLPTDTNVFQPAPAVTI